MVEDLQAGWDAAVDGCLNGHETCSYGGPTPGTGYWLRGEGCPGKHGDVCAWCDAEATTGFVGWADDGVGIFGVAACQPHADAWAAQHPEWQRGNGTPEDTEPESWEEALDGLNPAARAVAEDYRRAMLNIDLYGDPDGPPPGFRPGGLLAGYFDGIGALLASAPDTGRWRFNQATKRWEAAR